MTEATPLLVFEFALVTALATGVGAIPFAFVRRSASRWLGVANAVAAGLMLSASFGLIYEGIDYGLGRTVSGVFIGLAFLVATRRALSSRDDLAMGAYDPVDAVKIVLIVGVMTLHSVTEGIGLGVSFGGGQALGIFITVAIAVHNIPEGLAIGLVMVPRGASVWRAAAWSVFSSLPQPMLAVPAFLLVEQMRPVLPLGLGFAGGAMIWMVFSELIPEALEEGSANTVAVVVTAAAAAMVAFQVLLKG